KLSPFELKDKLIALADEAERDGDIQLLNAGRGNPNWICTTPREAFATLLRFGIEDSRRDTKAPDLGMMPQKAGIAARFTDFLERHKDLPGTHLLKASLDYGARQLGLDPDTLVHELTEGAIG